MLQTLRNAIKTKDVRKKLLFTLAILVIYRIGAQIPVPGINRDVLSQVFEGDTGLFALFNLFSGGAFSNFTIFALSITPYITASIIIQLLEIAIPSLERLAEEGMTGRKKLAQYTRCLTVALAIVQALGISLGLFREAIISTDVFSVAVIVMVLTAGTTLLMWLGEQINEHGIGNGISLIIFASIIARLPSALQEIYVKVTEGAISIVTLVLFGIFCVLVIVGIIAIQQGQRRIPVQYAQRVTGRKMYGGQSTHIPLKVNQAGVIPVIFAMSFLQFPLTITYFLSADSSATAFISKWLSPTANPGVWVYSAINVVLIIFFTYFYTSIVFKPTEISKNLKASGGFVPGIRPGTATEQYLDRVMTRITLVSALFLAVVAILPTIVSGISGLDFRFGGTSLLIAVGVGLDTMKQLEQNLVSRNYKGFIHSEGEDR